MREILVWADFAFFLGFLVLVVLHVHLNLRTWAGMAVAIAGFVLWLAARLQLGSAFSLKARARPLVTTGLYRRFRHPVYLFGFFAFAGVFLVWGKWVPFLCYVLVFFAVEVPRMRKEERVLEEAFGDQYRQHKAHTRL